MDQVSPVLRSPFTDMSSNCINHQLYGQCADFEMKAQECLEAYGLERGKIKCIDILEDFFECSVRYKQRQRVQIMEQQRAKLIKEGKLKGDETQIYSTPKPASF